jgi:hypothetical protein
MEILLLVVLGYFAFENKEVIYDEYEKIKTENFENKKEDTKAVDQVARPEKPTTFKEVDDGSCPTEVTEIFYSKASGEITTCKGKLLEPGQKTRIRRVNR